MPDNIINIHNSTFINNRHAVVVKHYDETVDMFGNLRKRYCLFFFSLLNIFYFLNFQIMKYT
jgi:hypothetical protein